MTLWEQIIEVYPELTDKDFHPEKGVIHLHDDGDGIEFIKRWDYEQSIPKGLKLGKPKA